jgi:membrane protein
MQDDVLNTAKATAYSGMLMLFPAFLVLTTLLALEPAGNDLLDEFRDAAGQFLPSDTMSLLQSYFQTRRGYSLQVILSATSLSTFAALGVMLSLMEGFRKAYQLPRTGWGFWERRIRALLLVPIALVPLSIATLVLIFGHPIEIWMIEHSEHGLLFLVLLLWRLARWTLAVLTSMAVLGAVYHFGTQRTEHWAWVAPGSMAATAMWFPTTLAFGWYVTSVADYSMIYGSLGTGIATLVWLYLTSFSILFGAELNGVLYRDRQARMQVAASPVSSIQGSPVTTSISGG